MHSSLHFYWYTNLFCLVWSPQQEERTIKWSRNIKQSASWIARRLRSSLNGLGEELFPLSSCWLRWSVREVKGNSVSWCPVWENICCPSPLEFVHCPRLHRNYGLTAEEDKAASPKRGGFLALLLWSFVSSFSTQQHSCLFGACPGLREVLGWAGRHSVPCEHPFPAGLTCSECLLPRSCFKALSIRCSPSWMFHHQRGISSGALANIFYWQMRAWTR